MLSCADVQTGSRCREYRRVRKVSSCCCFVQQLLSVAVPRTRCCGAPMASNADCCCVLDCVCHPFVQAALCNQGGRRDRGQRLQPAGGLRDGTQLSCGPEGGGHEPPCVRRGAGDRNHGVTRVKPVVNRHSCKPVALHMPLSFESTSSCLTRPCFGQRTKRLQRVVCLPDIQSQQHPSST